MVMTDYKGKRVISTSDTLSQNVINQIIECSKERTLEQTYEAMQGKEWGLRLSYMYRMFRDVESAVELNKQNRYHISYLPKYKNSLAKIGEETIGYCKISNVYGVYGNIVVWVNEQYRRQGIASLLLQDLLERCKNESITPMYLARNTNKESICLAQKFGFQTRTREIVFCEEK